MVALAARELREGSGESVDHRLLVIWWGVSIDIDNNGFWFPHACIDVSQTQRLTHLHPIANFRS